MYIKYTYIRIDISVQRRGGDASGPLYTRLLAIGLYIICFYILEIYFVSSPFGGEWERGGRGEFEIECKKGRDRERERRWRSDEEVRDIGYQFYYIIIYIYKYPFHAGGGCRKLVYLKLKKSRSNISFGIT